MDAALPESGFCHRIIQLLIFGGKPNQDPGILLYDLIHHFIEFFFGVFDSRAQLITVSFTGMDTDQFPRVNTKDETVD